MKNIRQKNGFTLIELLIVIAIFSILGAIAIPSYLGMQERGKIGSVKKACNANIPELQGWIDAVKKGGSILGNLREVDSSGDRVLDGNDDDNDTLAVKGIVSTFIASSVARGDTSPWSSVLPLWVNGGVSADQSACDTTAATNPGQVTLCYTPAENQTVINVYVSAVNLDGVIIYAKSVNAD